MHAPGVKQQVMSSLRRSAWVQQCRELLGMRDLWGQAEAAVPSAAAELKQLTGILAGVEASCRSDNTTPVMLPATPLFRAVKSRRDIHGRPAYVS